MTANVVRTCAPFTAAVLLLAALAGCAAPASSDAGAAAPHRSAGPALTARPAAWPSPVPADGLTKGLVLPLEAYMETYPESVVLARAVNLLQERCMARYGFRYRPPDPGTTPPPSYDDANMARRYGIADRAQALRLGYALGDETEPPPDEPRLTRDAATVLTGGVPGPTGRPAQPVRTYRGKAVPDGGCAGASMKEVGLPLDTSLAGTLDAGTLDASQADPRVRNVMRAWAGCMHAKGYPAADNPLDAAGMAQQSTGAGTTPAQRVLATADVDCKAGTGLVRVWFTVESTLQRRQVARHRAALRRARDRISAAVARARAVAG